MWHNQGSKLPRTTAILIKSECITPKYNLWMETIKAKQSSATKFSPSSWSTETKYKKIQNSKYLFVAISHSSIRRFVTIFSIWPTGRYRWCSCVVYRSISRLLTYKEIRVSDRWWVENPAPIKLSIFSFNNNQVKSDYVQKYIFSALPLSASGIGSLVADCTEATR